MASFRCRVAALGAAFLLDVVGAASAANAERVRLVVALAKARRSFRLKKTQKESRKRSDRLENDRFAKAYHFYSTHVTSVPD